MQANSLDGAMLRQHWPMRWRMEGLRLNTMDAERRCFDGSIEVSGDRIVAIGPSLPPPEAGVTVIDRQGWTMFPGFIQGHVHLCQTLFRGQAEGRSLDLWLRERIWPLEAAHTPRSLEASAKLGIAEILLHGATTVLDMGTVHHTALIARVAEQMGIRAILGKALMDTGPDLPRGLAQDPQQAFAEALALHEEWHGASGGRIRVAFAPRFILSVSKSLWAMIAAESRRTGILIHTHVSETPWENETCQRMHGSSPVKVLDRWGILDCPAVLVHVIWIDEEEREILRRRGVAIIHCPGSNAKLGSGIADVVSLLQLGIPVGLGSDGAACNDAMSIPLEMRLAAQLQSLRHAPAQLKPDAPLAMATTLGARALGLDNEIGSLEEGRRADLVLFGPGDLGWAPDLPAHHHLTFGCAGERPREVFVDGHMLVSDGALVQDDLERLRAEAVIERAALLERAALKE